MAIENRKATQLRNRSFRMLKWFEPEIGCNTTHSTSQESILFLALLLKKPAQEGQSWQSHPYPGLDGGKLSKHQQFRQTNEQKES